MEERQDARKEKQRDMSCDGAWHRKTPSNDVFTASATNICFSYQLCSEKKTIIIKGILIIPLHGGSVENGDTFTLYHSYK